MTVEPAEITAIRARAASSEGWPVLLPADRDRLTALAYIDELQFKLPALESETESGEALIRARHYQGLCEELRGKVAELEATRAQSIAESIAERAGSGYIAQVPVRRGWMHPDEFCEHGIKHSKPCRWCYPPVPVSPQPEDDPK